ncbi:MAG: hypothetical protein ACRDHL_06555 [Candidatus Promineifilaceae bacterium]
MLKSSWLFKGLLALLAAGVIGQLRPLAGLHAFPVPPLPAGNLITNPWFRDPADPNASSLAGWTDAGGLNAYWSSSQKASNPTPDVVISGVCGGNAEMYCGTAGRLSWRPGQSGGVAVLGEDAYLYQVVSADPAARKLHFSTHWVSHVVDPAEIVIYGGQSPAGPWAPVWTPFHLVQYEVIKPPDGRGDELWMHTGALETVLAEGFPYYKVEAHARLPEGYTVGFKFAGVYFAAEGVGSEVGPSSTQTPASTSVSTPAGGVDSGPSVTPPDASSATGGPVLTARVLSPFEIELVWPPVAGNQRGYEIERSPDGVTQWARLARLAADARVYTDENLAPGSTYYYRLRTSNASDSSGVSNVVSATTLAQPAPTPTSTPAASPTAAASSTPAAQANLPGSAETGGGETASEDGGVNATDALFAAGTGAVIGLLVSLLAVLALRKRWQPRPSDQSHS